MIVPASALAAMAHSREVEKPKRRLVLIMHVIAQSMTGFLPKRSDARPQAMAKRAWERENEADVTPTHLATSLLETLLKPSTISGRYGLTLESAIGSAKRHILSTSSWWTGRRGVLWDLPMLSIYSRGLVSC